MKGFCISFMVLGLYCSCGRSLDPVQLNNWMEDQENGLVKSQELKNFRVSAVYQPTDLIALKNCKRGDEEVDFTECSEEYKENIYIELRLEPKDSTDKDPRNWNEEFISLLDFKLAEHMELVSGNDTLPCVFHHLERPFHLRPYIKVLTVFERPHEGTDPKDIRLRLDIPGQSITQEPIVFDHKDLQRIPKLKI